MPSPVPLPKAAFSSYAPASDTHNCGSVCLPDIAEIPIHIFLDPAAGIPALSASAVRSDPTADFEISFHFPDDSRLFSAQFLFRPFFLPVSSEFPVSAAPTPEQTLPAVSAAHPEVLSFLPLFPEFSANQTTTAGNRPTAVSILPAERSCGFLLTVPAAESVLSEGSHIFLPDGGFSGAYWFLQYMPFLYNSPD